MLKAVKEMRVLFDKDAISLFIESPVFEQMLGAILYEAIFEFFQRMDVVGNIVNKLPLIGPVRKTIVKEFKSQLDKTLGGQIKSFLSSFNKVAVKRMTSFILSAENEVLFMNAVGNVVETLSVRPLSSLIQVSLDESVRLRNESWDSLSRFSVEDTEKVVNFIYDKVDSKTFDTLLADSDNNTPIVLSESVEKVLDRNLAKFLHSKEGEKFVQSINQICRK